MPLAVRRVGGTEAGAATYTLGPGETFRLDACTFTVAWTNEGGFVIPTLQARNQGGDLIADIAAPAVVLSSPVFPSAFTYTGPASLTDDFSVDAPDAYVGYLLHDFGGTVTQVAMDCAFPQPPAIGAHVCATWGKSSGAVTMGGSLGEATTTNTSTVTVTLTGGIASGHILLFHVVAVQSFVWSLLSNTPPAASDSRGAGTLFFDNAVTLGYAIQGVTRTDGLFVNSCIEFYQVHSALSAGDTVTFTLPSSALWLSMRCHDVAGLTFSHPSGPNPGGNVQSEAQGSTTTPVTLGATVAGLPKWVGPVFINSSYAFAPGGNLDVSLARGETHPIPEPFSSQTPTPTYSQMGLPELHLVQGDTITATSMDETGPRTGDLIENFLIYGVDIAAG